MVYGYCKNGIFTSGLLSVSHLAVLAVWGISLSGLALLQLAAGCYGRQMTSNWNVRV